MVRGRKAAIGTPRQVKKSALCEYLIGVTFPLQSTPFTQLFVIECSFPEQNLFICDYSPEYRMMEHYRNTFKRLPNCAYVFSNTFNLFLDCDCHVVHVQNVHDEYEYEFLMRTENIKTNLNKKRALIFFESACSLVICSCTVASSKYLCLPNVLKKQAAHASRIFVFRDIG